MSLDLRPHTAIIAGRRFAVLIRLTRGPRSSIRGLSIAFGELAVLVALLQVIDVVIRSLVVTSTMGVTLVHPAWPLLKRQSTGLRPSSLPPVSTIAVTAPSSRYMHIQHGRRERKARHQHPYSFCSKPRESPIGYFCCSALTFRATQSCDVVPWACRRVSELPQKPLAASQEISA